MIPEEDGVLSYHSMDPSKIYFNDEEFQHASGIHYDTEDKQYWGWVSFHPDDLRKLFYVPSNNMLQLAVRGEMGANNKEILQADDWNKKRIYTEASKGYRPDLLRLFKMSFKEFKTVEHEIFSC